MFIIFFLTRVVFSDKPDQPKLLESDSSTIFESAKPNTLYMQVTNITTDLPFLAIFHRDTAIDNCSSVCPAGKTNHIAGVYFEQPEDGFENFIFLSKGYMTIQTGEKNTSDRKQAHLISTRRYSKFVFGDGPFTIDKLKKNRTINIDCDINYIFCDYKVESFNYDQQELNNLVYDEWPYHRIYTTDLNVVIPPKAYLVIEMIQPYFDFDLRPLSFYFDESTPSQVLKIEGLWVSYNWDKNMIWVIVFSLFFGIFLSALTLFPKIKKLGIALDGIMPN